MSETPARTELERLAHVARQQGKGHVAAVCQAALGYIAELEGELHRVRGNAKLGALTRLQKLTPAQRTLIAQKAAAARWHPHHANG